MRATLISRTHFLFVEFSMYQVPALLKVKSQSYLSDAFALCPAFVHWQNVGKKFQIGTDEKTFCKTDIGFYLPRIEIVDFCLGEIEFVVLIYAKAVEIAFQYLSECQSE